MTGPRQPRLWVWLGTYPSQQGLAALVTLLWIPTCACSLAGCHIDPAWDGTLLGLTFAAVLHYGIKRWSFKPGGPQDVDADPPTSPSAGDR